MQKDGTVTTPLISSVNIPTPERALAISAHPDDSELTSGSTLAKWAADGCEVSILVCTDGSKGTWKPDMDLDSLIAMRQDEQRAAAAALGATGEVVFCGWVDGELESGLEQRSVIAKWIRKLRPNVVLGHDPWKRYRLHPDHRHAGLLTVEGIVGARDPHFFPEHGVAHHRPDTLLLFEADEPNHVEDVAGWEGKKIDALERHESQLESTMFISESDDGAERVAFRTRMLDTQKVQGELAGLSSGEAFRLIADL